MDWQNAFEEEMKFAGEWGSDDQLRRSGPTMLHPEMRIQCIPVTRAGFNVGWRAMVAQCFIRRRLGPCRRLCFPADQIRLHWPMSG
jgi:hypothetical protein